MDGAECEQGEGAEARGEEEGDEGGGSAPSGGDSGPDSAIFFSPHFPGNE